MFIGPCIMNACFEPTLLCSVCGDTASGYHYGAITCNGCKGFFYRSILAKKEYRRCKKAIGCFVVKSNRNACQFCRYQRCIESGMSYRTMRKFKIMEKTRPDFVLYPAMPSRNERKTFDYHLHLKLFTSTVCDAYRKAVKSLETFPVQCTQENAAIEEVSDIKLLYFRYLPAIIRFATTFATEIPAFNSLSRQCQVLLTKTSLIEIAAFTDIIQLKRNLSSMYQAEFKIFIPKERLHLIGSFGSSLERINQVKMKMDKLFLTPVEIALMSAIVLFCPFREGLTQNALVGTIEKDLTLALKIRLDSRRENESLIFPKVIEILTELRAISALYLTDILNIKLNTISLH